MKFGLHYLVSKIYYLGHGAFFLNFKRSHISLKYKAIQKRESYFDLNYACRAVTTTTSTTTTVLKV